MGLFQDSLKKWFYKNGTKVLTDTSRVTLLDASGNPLGSASMDEFVRKVAATLTSPDDYVDLGLPSGLLWGTKNIGATSPTGWGWYFSWGNLDGHPDGSGYNFSQDVYDATDAASISQDLDASQDAVRAIKGGTWRMPTQYDFAELFNSAYTTNEWTTVDGVNGRKVTSKINGKSVFFPAAGDYDSTSLYGRGAVGYYWSSSWISAASARDLYFNSSSVNPQHSFSRLYGFSLRGVM
jgi:hypothetical protein